MKTIAGILLLSIAFVSCHSGANTQKPSAQYEEKKTSLADMERESPLKFLKVAGSHHTNMVYQTVVEGEVTNSTTQVAYKNIELQLTYADKDGAVIEKQKQMLEDAVQPNGSLDFKIKTKHVKGAVSVSLDIVGAMPEK